jgi:hypothetical protein
MDDVFKMRWTVKQIQDEGFDISNNSTHRFRFLGLKAEQKSTKKEQKHRNE